MRCLWIHNCVSSYIEHEQTYSTELDITQYLKAQPPSAPLMIEYELEVFFYQTSPLFSQNSMQILILAIPLSGKNISSMLKIVLYF